MVALNASDARSKKIIKEQFSHLVQNRSMEEYFHDEAAPKKARAPHTHFFQKKTHVEADEISCSLIVVVFVVNVFVVVAVVVVVVVVVDDDDVFVAVVVVGGGGGLHTCGHAAGQNVTTIELLMGKLFHVWCGVPSVFLFEKKNRRPWRRKPC